MTLKKTIKDGAEITLYVVIGIICCPIIVPLICYMHCQSWPIGKKGRTRRRCGGRDNHRNDRANEVLKEKWKNRPRSLPPSRRELSVERELSAQREGRRPRIDFSRLRGKGKRKVASPIMRLPAELRSQILLEVLGQSVIHLVQCRGRLGHIRCKIDDMQSFPYTFNDQSYDIERRCIPPCQFSCKNAAEFRYPYVLEHVTCTTLHPPPSESCLGVLRTCRQLYREGIDVLYSRNIFDANDAETVLFLARTIRPQRLKAIKHLQINAKDPWPCQDISGVQSDNFVLHTMNDWPPWVECCKLIGSQMTGLQSLTVRVGVFEQRDAHAPNVNRDFRRGLYNTMLGAIRDSGIKGLEGFRLEIEREEAQVVEELQQGLRDVVCG
jgi:hypothetical protein